MPLGYSRVLLCPNSRCRYNRGYSLVSLMLQDRPQEAVKAPKEKSEEVIPSQLTGTTSMATTLKCHFKKHYALVLIFINTLTMCGHS